MKTCNSSSLLAKNSSNEDDEGKLDSDNLATMNRGCYIWIFLLSVALWKDLNPGYKVIKCDGYAMDVCLLWSVCPLTRQPKLDWFERVFGNLSTAASLFLPFLNMPLKARYDEAVLIFMSWLHSCHFKSAWQSDKIDSKEKYEWVLHHSPNLNKFTDCGVIYPLGEGLLGQVLRGTCASTLLEASLAFSSSGPEGLGGLMGLC